LRGAGNEPNGKKSATELEKSLEEIKRLRQENAQLRERLGIGVSEPKAVYSQPEPPLVQANPIVERTQEARIYEEHGLSNPARPPGANSNFSSREKIKLFRTLFRGREDVYAVFWFNERTGKKGYSPACNDPWSLRKGKPKKYLPLTDEVILSHLTG